LDVLQSSGLESISDIREPNISYLSTIWLSFRIYIYRPILKMFDDPLKRRMPRFLP